jgi:anti-sigma regulatory factor (Ser/Thr protein kinase)
MRTPLVPPEAIRAPGNAGYAIVRCLSGLEPEHRARRLVADVLAAVEIQVEPGDVEVAVNELVTNARQHAPGPYELRIVFERAWLKVVVVDGGADHAELARRFRDAAARSVTDDESGRGLQIVTGLFPGSWGTGPTSTCTGLIPAKQVWITVSRRPWPEPGWGVAEPDRVACAPSAKSASGVVRFAEQPGGGRA